jgi:aryl-alcohol dehydrogenase-like predicted oxidoreductase
MRTRPLGDTGLAVSEIGFGCWRLGGSPQWGAMSNREALNLVAAARDRGCNSFDTAPNYAHTNSERLLGLALDGCRHEVVVISKFGHLPGSDATDFSVSGFWNSLHGSLQRLRSDYLDVCLVHSPPAEVLSPEHELWDALGRARAEGKLRHFGASVDTARDIRGAAAVPGVQVVEVLFNMLQQDARKAFACATENAIGLIAKVPLDSGWLGGLYNAASEFDGIRARWSPAQIEARAAAVRQLRELLPPEGALAAQALAYILSYDAISTVIPGAHSVEQVDANCAASGARLAPTVRSQVEALWESITVDGNHPLPW